MYGSDEEISPRSARSTGTPRDERFHTPRTALNTARSAASDGEGDWRTPRGYGSGSIGTAASDDDFGTPRLGGGTPRQAHLTPRQVHEQQQQQQQLLYQQQQQQQQQYQIAQSIQQQQHAYQLQQQQQMLLQQIVRRQQLQRRAKALPAAPPAVDRI